MKILVSDLIAQLLKEHEMNVHELFSAINKTRPTRMETLRCRLEYMYRIGKLARRGSDAGPVYCLATAPTFGHSENIDYFNSLLLRTRSQRSAERATA